MKMYSRVYFSLCLILAVSERSRTQLKFNPRGKFPTYSIGDVNDSNGTFFTSLHLLLYRGSQTGP